MKVFEFYFNPKGKENIIFDSFNYQPENVYEKRLGSLFLINELRNPLPKSEKFLEDFSSFFKKDFYSSPIKLSSESAFRHTLKNANEYLEKIAKSGDVSWLGNFSSVIVNIKNYELNFTKVGTVKILLSRAGKIIDIGKNLELQEIEPYPLKIFGSIVSGKLAENDLIFVFTKEIYDFFINTNLLKEISKIQFFDERKLRIVLKSKEKELLNLSGVFLLICLVKKSDFLKEEKPFFFLFQPKTEKFSFKKIISPAIKFLSKRKKIKFSFPKILKINFLKKESKEQKETKKLAKKIKIPSLKILNFKRFSFKIPSFRLSHLNFFKNISFLNWKKIFILNKNVVLILALIFIIFLGNFLFQNQEKQKVKEIEKYIIEIEKSISQAENYLNLGNEKKAYEIYKDNWEKISNLMKEKNNFKEKLAFLKNFLEEKIEKITKLEKVSDPKLLIEFDEKDFIPQKMVFFEKNFYFFSFFNKKINKLNLKGERTIIETNEEFSEAAPFDNSLIFLKKPNLIFFLKNDQLSNAFSLTLPYPDFEPKSFCSFRESVYFLDSKKGEIVKYPYPLKENKDFPQLWLSQESKKIIGAKSMTIDGTIWILNEDNTISQYYAGKLKSKLELELFPKSENFTNLKSFYGLLYILEPLQKRIIIVDQKGKIIKQIQSEKFDNLKDFSVSDDGRTIWILNGTKVFELSF